MQESLSHVKTEKFRSNYHQKEEKEVKYYRTDSRLIYSLP
jgi:hypothetical protein